MAVSLQGILSQLKLSEPAANKIMSQLTSDHELLSVENEDGDGLYRAAFWSQFIGKLSRIDDFVLENQSEGFKKYCMN